MIHFSKLLNFKFLNKTKSKISQFLGTKIVDKILRVGILHQPQTIEVNLLIF